MTHYFPPSLKRIFAENSFFFPLINAQCTYFLLQRGGGGHPIHSSQSVHFKRSEPHLCKTGGRGASAISKERKREKDKEREKERKRERSKSVVIFSISVILILEK